MLIEFSLANYRSFRERATLSMVAAKLRAKEARLDRDNLFTVAGLPDLLTSAAIYGRNASGKSNLIRALKFMRSFVLDSYRGTEETGFISVEPFRLSVVTAAMPAHFEIVFVALGIRYRYGFEATPVQVTAEWLYAAPKSAESMLFRRAADEIVVGRSFREGRDRAQFVRPNALFLTILAQFNSPTAQSILTWFRRLTIASGVSDRGLRETTQDLLLQGGGVGKVVEVVTAMDTGLEEIRVEHRKATAPPVLPADVPEELRAAFATILQHADDERIVVSAIHPVFGEDGTVVAQTEFDFDEFESEGTRKLFALAGPLTVSLQEGRVLVLDEFDARFHPLLSRRILELFNDPTVNPKHAQLVVATHDTSLLDNRLLRRDQIWFVEKDNKGASSLYSLAEFRGVRNDKDFERGYREGRYGAIPYITSLAETFVSYEATDVTQD